MRGFFTGDKRAGGLSSFRRLCGPDRSPPMMAMMTWNVSHRHMAISDCHSFASRELAVRYACALLDQAKEARKSAIRLGRTSVGGHEIRLIRADLS